MNVADYYDSNTRRFLKFGRLGGMGVVHRGVWGPGVADAEAAAHYVHDRIVADLRSTPGPLEQGIDLGCGVGASMVRIGEQLGASISGITISATQAEIAHDRLTRLPPESANRYAVKAGDFCKAQAYESLPETSVDFAYFIESFVHATDTAELWRLVSSRLRPGARVYICDDFLGLAPEGPSERIILDNYRRGWHINTLISPGELESLLREHGVVRENSINLTPHLKLNRFRDRMIRLAVPLLRPVGRDRPWWDNMLGGDALQRALSKDLIHYRLEIFEYRP